MKEIKEEKTNFETRLKSYEKEDKELAELEVQKRLLKVDSLMDGKSSDRKRKIERKEEIMERKRRKLQATIDEQNMKNNNGLRPQVQVLSRPLPKPVQDSNSLQRPGFVFQI